MAAVSPLTTSGHLEVEHLGNMTEVKFLDRSILDRETIRSAGEQFTPTPDQGTCKLLLNFANVQFLGGDAIAELITLQKHIETAGHQLQLCGLQGYEEILYDTRILDQVFHILPEKPQQRLPAPEGIIRAKIASDDTLRESQVVIADPQTSRADRIVKGLPSEFHLARFTDLNKMADYCKAKMPAAALLPLKWPGSSQGGEDTEVDSPVLAFLRAFGRQMTIFIYAATNRLPIEVYCTALAAGAKQIFNEEASDFREELRQALTRLVHNYQQARTEQAELIALFASHGVIGESPSMLEVFRRALKASQFHDLPVLIHGETGTGKQRLAEAIHRLDSRRCTKPFVSLNCSAINKTLAESELFGHTKGAFSGAQSDRPGIFRMADGGTLLLDEIGELDLDLQPKLLRVLQEHRLLPVGADYEHAVDVRIIAATNRPMQKMIEEGTFREDLFQRLNVFQIYIPPLRERPACVEVQAKHFLKIHQIGSNSARKVTDFGLRVLEALRLLPWKGNSRELENFIRETLAHKEQGTLLQMEDLPHWVLETLAQLRPRAPGVDSRETLVQKVYEKKMTLNQAMQEFERRLLQVVLDRNGGNRTVTAAELDLTPRSILNKIKKYGLE